MCGEHMWYTMACAACRSAIMQHTSTGQHATPQIPAPVAHLAPAFADELQNDIKWDWLQASPSISQNSDGFLLSNLWQI